MDGPFAETKEQLAGFYLVDAEDTHSALEIASKIPPAQVGCIEVRPVRELVSTRGERRKKALHEYCRRRRKRDQADARRAGIRPLTDSFS